MKADAYQVKLLLGFDRQLFAPLFQRPYVHDARPQNRPVGRELVAP